MFDETSTPYWHHQMSDDVIAGQAHEHVRFSAISIITFNRVFYTLDVCHGQLARFTH